MSGPSAPLDPRTPPQTTDTPAADELNAEALTTIENCLFVACLDEPLPTSFNGQKRLSFDGGVSDGRDDTAMAHQALHGGGTLYNTSNRWFDKTIQVRRERRVRQQRRPREGSEGSGQGGGRAETGGSCRSQLSMVDST